MSMTHTLADDQYTYNPDEHVEPGAEVCPYPGWYLLKPLSTGRVQAKDGSGDKLTDGWPTLRINRVQIDNPDGTTEKFAVFQEIQTKPFQRKGAGGKAVYVSGAVDVLRAIDRDAAREATNFEEVYQSCEQKLKGGESFVGFIGLTARDSAYIKARMAELGKGASKEDVAEVYNKATFRTKDFRNPDGTYRFTVQGPSGAVLNAKPTIARYVDSDKRDTVEIGPQQATAK